ncbi:hypothetical protein T440DRAFT_558688 [Plenodomus tracheiphilus IPT5]|uniref:CCZ1/INTU/HSP4 first Longin domain-containing protein n=1 Tax=Plenodomus tracheiphilus IPT5 TaxID=1408161 RepID=A0A6A7ASP3_9PLEO|nr:hypothetical protein T440DRAFT_558688 [Plenodomus tracheiphilus IPT5]
MSSTAIPRVVPAQLSFLAIYNPSLGRSDETFHKQIVFYYSKAAKTRSKLNNGDTQKEEELREQENEKLRQVGLAQGMVGFARSFSNGATVDSVETQKSRIVLHELEDGWWILASIDLTQLPAANSTSRADSSSASTEPTVEYSSREVSPPALLIQQLVRAQSTFLLHHGTTLETMFAKHGRPKFCSILEKYWSRFAATWDVLLHGSPAVDIYGGMKLAAGGELGMGVGEEEWGSSERDVLEDFARRTEGLVDVMVSRFGEASPLQQAKSSTDPKLLEVSEDEPWIGSGRNVQAADGVVFSGLGAVSRKSLRDLSHWVETIYCQGEYAYGIRDTVTSDRKKRQRRKLKPGVEAQLSRSPAPSRDERRTLNKTESSSTMPPGIPPPIVKAVESSLDKASAAADKTNADSGNFPTPESKPMLASLGDTETWMKYMTLGYGTAWGGGSSNTNKKTTEEPRPTAPSPPVRQRSPSPAAMRYIDPEPDIDTAAEKIKQQIQLENDGYFLIGLKGDMIDLDNDDENNDGNWNNRIHLRTIHLEVDRQDDTTTSNADDSDETPQYERELNLRTTTESELTRLRPIVYIHRPFIYTFLFSHQAYALSLSSFYRSIHSFFAPLHRSLNTSTSPSRVAARLSAASNPYTTTSSSTNLASRNTNPIYDLVYDPRTYTVHSSIPNIPDLGHDTHSGDGGGASTNWSRIDALSLHAQLLATIHSTRHPHTSTIEITAKTSRGWWLVWMRIPPSHARPEALAMHDESEGSAQFFTDELREAFLVRRAREGDAGFVAAAAAGKGGRFASGVWNGLGLGMGMGMGGKSQSQRMGGVGAGWGPKGLVEGIGIDARRYVEELLSLNR